jgi:AcrR family transcriptional regulator
MRHSRRGKRHDKNDGDGRVGADRPGRPGRRGYHHGNLKEALVIAARQLILDKGPHGFSLIEAARLADVSPAAPYRHFKDKDALLSEVARRGFDSFADGLTAAWAEGEPDPTSALQRLGQAYLEFARAERASYAAMFEAGLDTGSNPDLRVAAERAYMAMANVSESFVGSDVNTGDTTPAEIFFHVWSLAHGAATLTSGVAPDGGISRDRAEEMLASGVEIYLRGLQKA